MLNFELVRAVVLATEQLNRPADRQTNRKIEIQTGNQTKTDRNAENIEPRSNLDICY